MALGGVASCPLRAGGAGDPALRPLPGLPPPPVGLGRPLLHSREAGGAPRLWARLPWQEAWAPPRTESGARLWADSRGARPCCCPAAQLPQQGSQCRPHLPGPAAGHAAFSGGRWPGCSPLGLSRAPRPAWAFCRCPLQRAGKGPVSPAGEALTMPETGATPAPGGSPVNSGTCESSTSNSSSS